MIGELREDNLQLTRSLRTTHEVCDRHNDVATAALSDGLRRDTATGTRPPAHFALTSPMSRSQYPQEREADSRGDTQTRTGLNKQM
jgi:hypothetical protein